MKCDNCLNDAAYTHADPGVNAANYCTNCLPHWLHERANAGHFPLVKPVVDPMSAEVSIVEVLTIEEPLVEEKVKKKAATKSTAPQD